MNAHDRIGRAPDRRRMRSTRAGAHFSTEPENRWRSPGIAECATVPLPRPSQRTPRQHRTHTGPWGCEPRVSAPPTPRCSPWSSARPKATGSSSRRQPADRRRGGVHSHQWQQVQEEEGEVGGDAKVWLHSLLDNKAERRIRARESAGVRFTWEEE